MSRKVPKYKMIFLLKGKFKHFFLFCFSLILCGASLCVNAQTSSVEQKIQDWRILLGQGEFQLIIDSCDYALTTLNFQNEAVLRSDIYSLKASAFRQLAQLDTAIFLHQKALAARIQFLGTQDARTASSYLNLGNCFLEKEQYNLAFQYLKKALTIKRQIFGEGALELLNVYTSLSNYYLTQQDFVAATNSLKKITSEITTEKAAVVPLYIALANIQLEQEQPDSAFSYLVKALSIQKSIDNFNHPTTANIYISLGNAMYGKGQYWAAVDTLSVAMELLQTFDGNHQKTLANCLINIGNCYGDLGDTPQALAYYNQALFFSKKDAAKIEILNSIALAYKHENKIREASTIFKDALNLYLNLPKKERRHHQLAADIYLNLGNCSLTENRVNRAIYYLDKGLTLHQELKSPLIKLARIKNNLSAAYLQQGNAEKAQTVIAGNLALAKKRQVPTFSFATNYHFGKIQEKEGNYTESLKYYQQALAAIQPKNQQNSVFPFERIQLYTNLAKVQLKLGATEMDSLPNALIYCEQGIKLLNQLKGNFTNTQSEINLQNTFYDLYNTAIASSLALANKEAAFQEIAFQYANQYKGNLLKKLSRQAKAKSTFQLPDSIFQQENALQLAINKYQEQQFFEDQQQQLLGTTYEASPIDSILQILNKQYSNFLLQLKQNYPAYFNLVHEVQEINIKTIQTALTTDQTLVEYQWGTDEIWAFVLTKDTFLVATIPDAKAISLKIQQINQLYTQRTDLLPKATRDTIFKELVKLAHDLHQILIDPIQKTLKKELIIIPDGRLCYLPFELLIRQPAPKNRYFRGHDYLIKEHAISYLYTSSSLLTQAATQKKDNNSKKILAVAPIFNRQHPVLNPLKHNRKEAELIQHLIGGQLWNQGEDSEVNFLEQMTDFPLIHLSTHGVLIDDFPQYSYLAFSNPADSLLNDELTVSEIYNLRLTTDMIVLSACKTADGVLSRGEGLLSLAHAFTYAGAKSLVASLWNVDDRHTPKLMENYYQYLKNGDSKAIALQRAKLAYMSSATQEEAFPFYWAGFVLIGDEAALFDAEDRKYIYYLIGLVVLLLVSFFGFRKFRKKQ